MIIFWMTRTGLKSIKPLFERRSIYLIYVQTFLLNYNCWYFENINQHSVKRQITWAMSKHRKIKFKTNIIDFFGSTAAATMYMYLSIRSNHKNWKYFLPKIERNMIHECGIKACVLFTEYFFLKEKKLEHEICESKGGWRYTKITSNFNFTLNFRIFISIFTYMYSDDVLPKKWVFPAR